VNSHFQNFIQEYDRRGDALNPESPSTPALPGNKSEPTVQPENHDADISSHYAPYPDLPTEPVWMVQAGLDRRNKLPRMRRFCSQVWYGLAALLLILALVAALHSCGLYKASTTLSSSYRNTPWIKP
jgi:hypothetical protein